MENKELGSVSQNTGLPMSLSLSQTLAESPSGVQNPPSLLILPGLLRSDQGGLSVSSPLGEEKDACSLRKWCKLLVLKFYWSPT